MAYTFQNLSHADFEDLTRDLIGKELGVRFEAFGPGPDGGMDGRHSSNGKSTILQAKHYPKSTVAQLKAEMRRAKAAIAKLKPRRYILVTSRDISPRNKTELARIIGRPLRRSGDILGHGDLNGLLRKFPEVAKATIKLWLSSTAMLERIVQSAAYTFTAISRADIEAKVRVYAQNPSFEEARKKLESTHVIIIAGPPGVGKTTLAEMLAYAYVGEEWEFVAIRSLEDGFARIVDMKKQVFFFDDFLGKVALDKQALAHKDSELARFIKRVRSSPNARFILTTRANIFAEARQFSEHLADERLDIARYVLDVTMYTRRIRARILYNHLVVAKMSPAYVNALLQGDTLSRIVDHKNYSPRIVESMTDKLHVGGIPAASYAEAFVAALDNPHQIWDIAFRNLPAPRRHLLYALFFSSQYGVELDELKQAYNALHPALCASFGHSHDPKDFEDSVKALESGFIKLQGQKISFINPSMRDYLKDYFSDLALLLRIVLTAQKVSWIEAIWNHVYFASAPFFTSDRFSQADVKTLASALVPLIDKILTLPVRRHELLYDTYISERIDLLLSWFAYTGDERFAAAALALAQSPPDAFSVWRDGTKVVELIAQIPDDYSSTQHVDALVRALEQALIGMLEGGVDADDLESIATTVESYRRVLSKEVTIAMENAISREVDDAMETARGIGSEVMLSEHAEVLRKFGRSAGVPEDHLERAVTSIEERIAEIKAETRKAAAPQFGRNAQKEDDAFDNAALRNLFAALAPDRA